MFIYIKKYIATILLVIISGAASTAQPNITAIEYFFDTDPGFNLGTPVAVATPATEISNLSFQIDVSALATGMHTFYIRTKNASNVWSLTNFSKIYKEFLYPVPPSTGPIRRLEYFIDTDPGFGNATPVSITANQYEIANLSFTVDLSAVPAGNHNFYVRTLDDDWGLTNVVLFMTNTVVPVKLINFAAKKVGTSAMLSWQTSGEQNNAGFDVQRSGNGIDFVKIGYVNGKGNSSTLQNYGLTDPQPGTGMNYYRLRQIDLDGRSTLSETRTLEFGEQAAFSLTLFPNPASQFLQIQLPEKFYGQAAIINICDASGRVVKQWTIARTQRFVLTLPVAELPAGTWHVLIVTKDNRATGSFIK